MSTPTVSRFESGGKNIQLASVLAILDALGMIEHSPIEFPEKIERYDSSRDVVLFAARTREGEVDCAISGEALDDHFGAKGASQRARLAVFREHRPTIEKAARQKFLARRIERDGSILIRSIDTVPVQPPPSGISSSMRRGAKPADR